MLTMCMMKAINGQESEYPHPSYICTHEPDFILHEVFDNLHTRKISSLKPPAIDWLTLSTTQNILYCICSQQTINGFVYMHEGFIIDVQCASILEGCIQESYPRESLGILNCPTTCSSCEQKRSIMLQCTG